MKFQFHCNESIPTEHKATPHGWEGITTQTVPPTQSGAPQTYKRRGKTDAFHPHNENHMSPVACSRHSVFTIGDAFGQKRESETRNKSYGDKRLVEGKRWSNGFSRDPLYEHKGYRFKREVFLSINLIPLRKATNPSVNAAYNECKATGGSQLKHESQVS